jgi:hypothetical protein
MQIRLVTNWHKLDNMLTHFPKLFLRFLSNSVEKAAEYYVNMLGFHIDWSNDQGGIGGSSQGSAILTNAPFCRHHGNGGTVVAWLNLNSKQEVDELYDRWKLAGAKILARP